MHGVIRMTLNAWQSVLVLHRAGMAMVKRDDFGLNRRFHDVDKSSLIELGVLDP